MHLETKNGDGDVVLIFNYNDSVLGKALRDQLLKKNHTVCVTKSSDDSKNSEFEKKSREKYKEFHLNTSCYDEVENLKEKVESSLGRVDVVIILSPDVPETKILNAQDGGYARFVGDVIKSYYWAIKSFLPGIIQNRKGHFVGFVPFCEKSDAANVLRRSLMGLLQTCSNELITFQRDFISVTQVNNYCFRRSSGVDESQIAKRVISEIKTKPSEINIHSDTSAKSAFKRIVAFVRNCIVVLFQLILIPVKALFLSSHREKFRKDIKNEVALVTGGGMGLGREISLSLGRKGCCVAIADIDYESAQKTADMLKELHIKAKAYKTDVSNAKDVAQLKLDVTKDWGNVNILVNNAGLMPVGSILQAKVATVEKTIDVNLLSHFTMVNTFLPDMVKSKKGHVIAISSLAGILTVPGGVVYCSTKYGVTALMDSLELELKSTGNTFVKTTTIHPYFIRTRQDLEFVVGARRVTRVIPWLSPNEVGNKVVNAILENKRRVLIPNIKYFLLFVSTLPKFCEKFLYGKILKGLNDLEPEGKILT